MSNNDFINNGILEYDIDDWENWDGIEEDEEVEEYEPISDKDFKTAIKASQEVITTFVREVFGKKQLKKIEKVLKDVNCELDKDLSSTDTSGYFDGENIFIVNEFASRNKDTYHLIHTLIHEYAHAFSRLIIKNEQIYFGLNDIDSMINPIVEEAFANMFAEMSINNYYKKDRTLSYFKESKEEILSLNHSGNDFSYYEEGNFLKTIFYFLKKENRDLSAFEKYFFESKGDFADECISVLGEDVWEIFKRLRNVRNGLGEENNTNQYLPKEILNLINSVEKNMIFDEKEYESSEGSELYHTQNCILDYISFLRSNKLGELSANGIDRIIENSKGRVQEICTSYGYNDSLKAFIFRCLKESNNDSNTISKMIELAGGIPFDIIKTICDDKDINYIIDMYIKCNVLSLDCNYEDAMIFLQDKIANEKGEETDLAKRSKNTINEWTKISNLTLLYLLKKEATNDQLKVILDFYIGNPNLYDINSAMNVIEEIGDEGLDEEAKNGLGNIVFDIGNDLESIDEIKDLQLLKEICSKNIINGDTVGYYLKYNTTAIPKIENDVSEAIECFNKYGCNIENKEEIINEIRQGNYRNLRIESNIDLNVLKQLNNDDIDKISILLNMIISQFLERKDLDLTNGSKDYNDILFLIDFDTQEKFKMQEYVRANIFEKVRDNVISSENSNEMDMQGLIAHVEKNQSYFKNKSKIKNYIESIDELYLVSDSIKQYLYEKKLTDEELHNLIVFFEEDKHHYRNSAIEYNLETINKVVRLVEYSDLEMDSPNYQEGEEQFIHKLIHATSITKLTEENKLILYEIYKRLKTIKGLEIEDIDESFFATTSSKDEIQNDEILQSGVIAAETTRIGLAKTMIRQVIENIKESVKKDKNDIEKDN